MHCENTFVADAVIFDMDGTLTDSIAAVEAAWGKVADDIGQDRATVIAATHGKRAIDNLKEWKPHLQDHEMETEVERFECTILAYADASRVGIDAATLDSSNSSTEGPLPSLTDGSSGASSSSLSDITDDVLPQGHWARRAAERLSSLTSSSSTLFKRLSNPFKERTTACMAFTNAEADINAACALEADAVDRSVRILPGVREMIDSIPAGLWAVATSGAKTYAHGCMKRVGITPPPVTITADDPRLTAGKPDPAPFTLAASCLGVPTHRCVVFEDSPSGVKAGVASGAIVIAVCTSHSKDQLKGYGAHCIVDDMRKVRCEVVDVEGVRRLKFRVRYFVEGLLDTPLDAWWKDPVLNTQRA